MRKSLSLLIDTCHDVKVHLGCTSYELHDYDSGAYADFKCDRIKDPRTLCLLFNGHIFSMFAADGYIVVRVLEKYIEEET